MTNQPKPKLAFRVAYLGLRRQYPFLGPKKPCWVVQEWADVSSRFKPWSHYLYLSLGKKYFSREEVMMEVQCRNEFPKG